MRRRSKVLLGCGGAVALALTLPAIAQDRPESILPPGFGDPATVPPPAPAPSPSPSPSATPSAPAAGPSEGGAVEEVSSLTPGDAEPVMEPAKQVDYPSSSRRDPALAGVIDPQAVGLGERPWGGAHGRALEVLMRRMNAPLANRWAHIGVRNALLAAAPAPYGVNPADWVAERSWLLLRMGEADGARLVLSSIDGDQATPKMQQVAVQTALATSDPSAMCEFSDGLGKVEPKVAPLVEAMCASLRGEPERAAADIANVRRRGRLSSIDVALADKVVGAGAETGRAVTIEWEPVQQLNSWRYGLATATGMLPPERLINDASPTMRAWLSRVPAFPAETRLSSARIAAALGVYSSEALVDLYSAQYDATDPDALGSTDAWQLRLAYVGKDADARLDAMRRLWTVSDGDYGTLASRVLLSRAARRVAPDGDLDDDAVKLVESLFAGGFDREAARWAPAIGSMSDKNGNSVWGLLAVGAPNANGLGIDKGRVDDFASDDDSQDKVRTGILIAALAGLGRVDNDTAGTLNRSYELGLGAKTKWGQMIDKAAANGQSGTVLLLVASAFQGGDAKKIKPFYVYHAVSALKKTGQEYLARMIAAEAVARA